jgi:hypothetical protein
LCSSLLLGPTPQTCTLLMSWLLSKLDKNDEETLSPQSQAPLLDPVSPQPAFTFSPATETPLLGDRPEIERSITTPIGAPHSQVLSAVQGKSTVAPFPSPLVSPTRSPSTRSKNPSNRPAILPQMTTEAHSYSLGGFIQSGGQSSAAGGSRSAAASTVKLPRSFSTELLPTADDVYGQGTIADVVYEPFTGAPVALLSTPVKKDTIGPTVTTGASSGVPARTEDPTRQKMWDYLAHIRGLQAEIAALHLNMDGAGIGTLPPSTTGGGKRLGSVGPGLGRAELERRTSVADPEDTLGNAGGEEGLAESRAPQEGKTRAEAEKEKEARLDAEFAQLNALFAGKREAMNQIMTKVSCEILSDGKFLASTTSHPSPQLRELSTLVRAYHELDPQDPGRASPPRGNTVDSAPLSLDGYLVSSARELPPSAQPLSPQSSDPELPSPLHLDYSPGPAKLQGQASPSAGVNDKSAKPKPRIAPILTTSPSSSMPATPIAQQLQSQSTAMITQHLATHTSSGTTNKAISLVPTSSPRSSPGSASMESTPSGSHEPIPEPGSGADSTQLPATRVHPGSQMWAN